ncbi:MAG: helix-turn-helix domain-containing protein [Rhodopila sp.]|nr:helix-turn-helix domain-containing protein [Rhodopila sp.]
MERPTLPAAQAGTRRAIRFYPGRANASFFDMNRLFDRIAPQCPPLEEGAGSLVSFSTDSVPPAQRPGYWHDGVLRRLDTAPELHTATPFHARLTRLAGAGAELLEHTGSALAARRDVARCQADACDDISIDFMAMSSRASVTHGGARRVLRAGDMIVMDLSQPAELKRAKHRVISLFIPRTRVRTAISEPDRLAGRLLQPRGVAALLRSHMQMTMDQAAQLQPAQRAMAVAVAVAVEMALTMIRDEAPDLGNIAVRDTGFYQAAKIFIARDCTNPALTPLHVAQHLGYSRTGLYRVFVRHGKSVSKTIWSARIAHARQMLKSKFYRHLLVAEIVLRSGFSDHSTFDRMFRRAYGITPGEMRRVSLESS